MPSKYGILCILLSFIILILGYENYEIWSSPSAMTSKKEVKRGEIKPEAALPGASPKDFPPRDALNVIAEKNVFNPERKEFSAVSAAAMARPVNRPQITLYGLVTAEDYQIASIINPGRPLHKGEREMRTVKVGDTVGDYKLIKIMPDRIVMEAGDDSFEVLLYDPRTPKRRVEVRTSTQPVTVTSVGATTTPPGTPAPYLPVGPTPAAGVTLPPMQPPSPAARPVTPLPVLRPPGAAPEGAYQTPTPPPAPTTPATPPDPGVWRGRRPVTPGSPPG